MGMPTMTRVVDLGGARPSVHRATDAVTLARRSRSAPREGRGAWRTDDLGATQVVVALLKAAKGRQSGRALRHQGDHGEDQGGDEQLHPVHKQSPEKVREVCGLRADFSPYPSR